jgi:hypothetical protein
MPKMGWWNQFFTAIDRLPWHHGRNGTQGVATKLQLISYNDMSQTLLGYV